MDVDTSGGFPRWGEAEGGAERCVRGEKGTGVDEADGRGAEGEGEVWADEGGEG